MKQWRAFGLFMAVLFAATVGVQSLLHAQDPPAAAETAAAPAEGAVPAAAPTTPPADPVAALTSGASAMRIGLDTVWVLIAGMLVFWMNAGFALVESGLCQAKNCTNILAKNFVVFAMATVAFWVIGWGLMFGDGSTAYYGDKGLLFVSGADNSPALGEAYSAMNPFSTEKYAGDYGAINWTPVPLWAKFFFQLVFAGTAATIVSGAVAERIKFLPFLLFSLFLVAFVYPISGHWIWGGGFLGANNFRDFAGSTVVHSVGGWAALAGILVLGPRLGKFKPDGSIKPIPAHSMTSLALGVFILWLGWFGFNPGSTMSAGDGKAISHVLVATNIAACTGTVGALITAWLMLGKPDFSMIANGCLAGLVAVTAPCAFVTIESAALIGLIGGALAVFGVITFDKLKIDDPVGALSVHLLNGVFGTLCVGLFWDKDIATSIAALPPNADVAETWGRFQQTMVQLKGIACVAVYAFVLPMVFWLVLKAVVGIRVTKEEELEGLDIGEHGNEAYPNFVGKQTVSFAHEG
jgi:ammonium transporter, Amt family